MRRVYACDARDARDACEARMCEGFGVFVVFGLGLIRYNRQNRLSMAR
jgi:hypothetical protein